MNDTELYENFKQKINSAYGKKSNKFIRLQVSVILTLDELSDEAIVRQGKSFWTPDDMADKLTEAVYDELSDFERADINFRQHLKVESECGYCYGLSGRSR